MKPKPTETTVVLNLDTTAFHRDLERVKRDLEDFHALLEIGRGRRRNRIADLVSILLLLPGVVAITIGIVSYRLEPEARILALVAGLALAIIGSAIEAQDRRHDREETAQVLERYLRGLASTLDPPPDRDAITPPTIRMKQETEIRQDLPILRGDIWSTVADLDRIARRNLLRRMIEEDPFSGLYASEPETETTEIEDDPPPPSSPATPVAPTQERRSEP